ncbi:MAG: lipopolysaccharide heptosyltransferase I [Janthinobacterium lividum]
MPVVADILRAHPEAQIDWVVEEAFVSLVALVHGVHRVIPCALRRWRKYPLALKTLAESRAFKRALRAQTYDLVIDCQGLLKTAWLASRARGKVVGLANRTDGAGYEWPVRFFYDVRVPIPRRTHVVERSRQLVEAALALVAGQPVDRHAASVSTPSTPSAPAALSGGTETVDKLLTLPEFAIDTRAASRAMAELALNLPLPYVVLIHATSRADKQWPDAAWNELGQALVRRGASIVLPWGSEAEREVSERLARDFGQAAIVPPKLSLPAVVGLLDGAAACVGVDTGLIHIAAALGRPTIELYNLPTAWRTGGYWSPRIVNLGLGGGPPAVSEVKRALTGFGLL